MENNKTNIQETNTQPKPKKNWRSLEVGAIWKFDDSERLTLKIKNKDGKDVRFVCFKNKFKDPNNREDDRLPTWRVYKDDSNYNPTAKVVTEKVEKKSESTENNEEFI